MRKFLHILPSFLGIILFVVAAVIIQHLSIFDMPYGSCHPSISSDGKAFYFVSSIDGSSADIFVSYNVPEPASAILIGAGFIFMRLRRR